MDQLEKKRKKKKKRNDSTLNDQLCMDSTSKASFTLHCICITVNCGAHISISATVLYVHYEMDIFKEGPRKNGPLRRALWKKNVQIKEVQFLDAGNQMGTQRWDRESNPGSVVHSAREIPLCYLLPAWFLTWNMNSTRSDMTSNLKVDQSVES